MSMGRRKQQRQEELWVATSEMPEAPGHPFYCKLNELLAEGSFDEFVEGLCERFYHEELGRPGIAPGTYFRMLLIGYFEGIDSERGIAWRCDDSRTLRSFLGYQQTERTPDHSTLSVIRNRIDLEAHEEVFRWVLKRLDEKKLLKGKTLGIDATTLEANAAMRSIVRKETAESYNAFLKGLAKASGIATPTREDLARIDRSRKNKASNEDWHNPHDPDARITKMKDGRTHLAHKAEHAVDLETGAIVAVTLQEANLGDTSTMQQTLKESEQNLRGVSEDGKVREIVADKGYHSNDTCRELTQGGIRTYLSEPDRGRRRWSGKADEQAAVYANRRRVRGARGKRLLRQRGELLERPFAHCYETGGMRRTHLRGHRNILKRLLVHVAGFNPGLVMRSLVGIGKPRRMQDGLGVIFHATWHVVVLALRSLPSRVGSLWSVQRVLATRAVLRPAV